MVARVRETHGRLTQSTCRVLASLFRQSLGGAAPFHIAPDPPDAQVASQNAPFTGLLDNAVVRNAPHSNLRIDRLKVWVHLAEAEDEIGVR